MEEEIIDEEKNITSSLAFKEYSQGRQKKLSLPWALIIITGVVTALVSQATAIFADRILQNPWALNFVIAIYGIPAGFIIGLRNKNLSAYTSLQYSSLSVVFYISTYFVIGLFGILVPGLGAIAVAASVISLFFTCLMIGLYSILCSFSVGAVIGTFVAGVLDNK